MPNHIMNRLRLSGDQNRIDELLKGVKGKDSVLDFNKIIPMPESLNIEAGSRTEKGLKAYKDFVYVYTFAGTEQKDLLNIPKEKEEIFLRTRQDIRRDEWELGKAAFRNERNTARRPGTNGQGSHGEQNGRRIMRKSAKITRSCSTQHGQEQCP